MIRLNCGKGAKVMWWPWTGVVFLIAGPVLKQIKNNAETALVPFVLYGEAVDVQVLGYLPDCKHGAKEVRGPAVQSSPVQAIDDCGIVELHKIGLLGHTADKANEGKIVGRLVELHFGKGQVGQDKRSLLYS